MPKDKSYLEGKKILAVDDEGDVLDTIEEALEMARLDKARDYKTALEKIRLNKYDLVILDIMGVDGLKLLEKSVERGFPTVMLTAHALNAETLIESIRLGAISYLPKETLAEIDQMLEEPGGLQPSHKVGRDHYGLSRFRSLLHRYVALDGSRPNGGAPPEKRDHRNQNPSGHEPGHLPVPSAFGPASQDGRRVAQDLRPERVARAGT